MRILVLGGGGFIGSAVVSRLLHQGYRVRIFQRSRGDENVYKRYGENIEWAIGEYSSPKDIESALNDVDVVIHLISTVLPKSSNEDMEFDIKSNVLPALGLLEAMASKGISRIIFGSSGGTIYGAPNYLPLDEEHSTEPLVSYGITKLAIEKYLLLFQKLHGIRSIVLRMSNPYGEGQKIDSGQGVVGVFIKKALNKSPIEIWGDGSAIRDYIYVGDVADAFLKAVQYEGKKSIFNISSGIGMSLNEIIENLEIAIGTPIVTTYHNARVFDVGTNVLSNKLAMDELGWHPKTSFGDGLAKTIKFFKNA
jgi:UDP-glucose 4-epimerase